MNRFRMAGVCALLGSALTASAQNSVKLFEASNIYNSGYNGAPDFNQNLGPKDQVTASKAVYVDCTTQQKPTGTIKGVAFVPAGGFFVDNFFQVTSTEVTKSNKMGTETKFNQYKCGDPDTPAWGRCFKMDPGTDWLHLGVYPPYYAPIYYQSVSPEPISDSLIPGTAQVLQIDLMDTGGIYGNSEIHLETSCALPPVTTLCHKPGTPAEQTMNLPNSAVAGHLGHGDTLGVCKTSSPSGVQ